MKHIEIAIIFLIIGISQPIFANEAQITLPVKQAEINQDSYVPGMGEIMGATQMRHSKLWFAGKAKNWELASYELDEIEEGLGDAIKYHPVFKKDAPIATILEKFTSQPIREIRLAIEAKDSTKFRKSFDSLTGACNTCHQAASQGFIVIKQPSLLPFSNQEFSVNKIKPKNNQ